MAREAEKTKTSNDRIETIARTFGVSHFGFLTLSHMASAIGCFVFNIERPAFLIRRPAGPGAEERPYGGSRATPCGGGFPAAGGGRKGGGKRWPSPPVPRRWGGGRRGGPRSPPAPRAAAPR